MEMKEGFQELEAYFQLLGGCWNENGTYASQSDTSTGSWGLVHLTEDEGDLGLSIKLDDLSLLHFVVQIVTLTCALSDTGEHGVTTVSLGDVVLLRVSVL